MQRLCVCLLMLASAFATTRRILVTGANKGIGAAIAKRILRDEPSSFVFLGSRCAARGAEAIERIVAAVPEAAGRLSCVELDVTSDASVVAALDAVRAACPGDDTPLYGLVINAGVGFGRSVPETLEVNLYGAERCCEAFVGLIESGGRVVTMASASGPNFVSRLEREQQAVWCSKATERAALDAVLASYSAGPDYDGIAYGLSKAALQVYTRLLATRFPVLKVNACSPGYVLTDLTKGMGATKSPDQSNCHVAPLFLLFGQVEETGRYYGSDGVRSPLDRYRGPGDPPYLGTPGYDN